ncbi:MAG: hypothetical protein L0H35_06405 [Psychrobacter sp.]|nr:hypothetical protein [Psychrobacter sp.]
MLGAFIQSFIIAKVLGLWFIIIAITAASKRSFIQAMVVELDNQKFAFYGFAIILLFLGLMLVTLHNFWYMNVITLVTIACWIILLKGVLMLAFPDCVIKLAHKMVISNWYWVGIVVSFIIGVILLSYGSEYIDLWRAATFHR